MPRLPGAPRNAPAFEEGSGAFGRFARQQVRDGGGRFAGGVGIAWQGLANIDDELYNYADRIYSNLHSAAEALKDEMVQYMKDNAIWTDHPGEHRDARDNLQGQVVWTGKDNCTIMLGHGGNVHYGIWLEVRWGGRYAIVRPTLEQYAPLIGGKLGSTY